MGAKPLIWIGILILLMRVSEEKVGSSNRLPRIYGEKIPFNSLLPTRRKIQNKIVLFHNYFRTKVKPRASNMLRMKWHKESAKAAQNWAEECMFLTHDSAEGRKTEKYGTCGQNIFVSSHQVPWLFAIKTWFSEKENFTYGGDDNFMKEIGHYTQMVWASTHEVGCGLSRCFTNKYFKGGIYYNYVCNYCPAGNRPDLLGTPYKKGKPCGRCKKHCHKNRLCTNSCPYADFWINCRELYAYSPGWLCHTETETGKERLNYCLATCKCRGKIFD